MVVFPIATFYMKDGVKHQIIVFNKRRFEKCFEEYCAIRKNKQFELDKQYN